MKRRELLRKCEAIGGDKFVFVREGANHTMYRAGAQIVPIPRHREINELTATGIITTVTAAIAAIEPQED